MNIVLHSNHLDSRHWGKPIEEITLECFFLISQVGRSMIHLADCILYVSDNQEIKIFKDRTFGRHGVFSINKHNQGLLRDYIKPYHG